MSTQAQTELARRMRASPSWQQVLWDIRHTPDSHVAFEFMAGMVLAEVVNVQKAACENATPKAQ